MVTAPHHGPYASPDEGEACPAAWFNGFTEGIRAEEPLLTMLLPRVAPEATVVAAAALGLQRAAGDGALEIRFEASTNNGLSRVDMVVCAAGNDRRWAFEWKLLWQPGLGECVGGIQRDLQKLKGQPRSAVLVFAFAVREAPQFCAPRITKVPLETTVGSAISKLGQEPYQKSDLLRTEQFGTRAEYQILAWAPTA